MKGLVLYQPKGKAGEYAAWAANLFVGCSNMCEYCYCKKGILAKAMGQDTPQLKAGLKDVEDAINTFKYELIDNLDAVRDNGGVFFSFSTDPCLPETWGATYECAKFAMSLDVPVSILTKCTAWAYTKEAHDLCHGKCRQLLAVGFTLTGHDELEPNAAKNQERIDAMGQLKVRGIKTFASVEPIVDLEASWKMIWETRGRCDLYKIGLMSGKKQNVNPFDLEKFVYEVVGMVNNYRAKVYFKESIFKHLSWSKSAFIAKYDGCVDSDYNIFEPTNNK